MQGKGGEWNKKSFNFRGEEGMVWLDGRGDALPWYFRGIALVA